MYYSKSRLIERILCGTCTRLKEVEEYHRKYLNNCIEDAVDRNSDFYRKREEMLRKELRVVEEENLRLLTKIDELRKNGDGQSD